MHDNHILATAALSLIKSPINAAAKFIGRIVSSCCSQPDADSNPSALWQEVQRSYFLANPLSYFTAFLRSHILEDHEELIASPAAWRILFGTRHLP